MDRRSHLQQVKVTTKEIKAGATGGLELAALYLRRSQSLLELHKLPMKVSLCVIFMIKPNLSSSIPKVRVRMIRCMTMIMRV